MITSLYQEYLYVIGKLKDAYGLDVDVDHKDIHTFFKNKRPLFKLFFGVFEKEENHSIVVSFHLDLYHAEAIQWFIHIFNQHPLVKLHDSWIEDSAGETYIGEDALAIKEVYTSQRILDEWLNTHDSEEIEQYVKAEVVGRERDPQKTFDSLKQKDEAIIEFKRMSKPTDDSEVH